MSIKFIQLPTCKLAEFVSNAATSFTVSGFLYNDGVTAVDPADIGDVCFATLEPKTAREELISFTIASVTSAGVATITATRGLSQKSPYGTGGASFDHQNGSDLVISNNPGLFNKLAAKANDEVVTGSWQFPAPSHVSNPITKSHYDDNTVKLTGAQTVAGVKTFSSAPKIPNSGAVDEALTKGESNTIEATNVKLTGNQTVAGVKTFSSAPIVPTSTNPTEAVNKGQMEAYIAANSGDEKATNTIFGQVKLDVAADIITEPIAYSATSDRVAALAGGGDFGTPSSTNKFVTEEYQSSVVTAPQIVTFTSSGTWTKDAGLKYVVVEAVGGGGGGSVATGENSAGAGGGGGYFKKLILASSLGATETVTVGTGGATGNPNGSAGGNTSFGSHATANGGGGGTRSSGGGGGSATGGNINIVGQTGSRPIVDGNQSSTSYNGSIGGSSMFGHGSIWGGSSPTGYGSGGCGYGETTSAVGGNAGIVIVTEYYS